MLNIQDKVILITGASSGIGEACARLLAEKGAQLLLGARRTERLEQVAGERGSIKRDERDALIIFDDTYTITGNANGIDREERYHETTITDMLVHEMVCRWPGGGKATMSVTDLKDRDVVYGDGFCEDNADCCDNNVTVEVGGKRERDVKLL